MIQSEEQISLFFSKSTVYYLNMAKFKSASIFLFVILLLVLVVSMIFGYHSKRENVTVTEGIMSEIDESNVDEPNTQKVLENDMYVVYTDNSGVTVLLDANMDANSNTSSVVILDASKNTTIITPQGLKVEALPEDDPEDDDTFAWVYNKNNLTIAFTYAESLPSVSVFDNKLHKKTVSSYYLLDDYYTTNTKVIKKNIQNFICSTV